MVENLQNWAKVKSMDSRRLANTRQNKHKEITLGHIIGKLLKTKDKKKISKAVRKK